VSASACVYGWGTSGQACPSPFLVKTPDGGIPGLAGKQHHGRLERLLQRLGRRRRGGGSGGGGGRCRQARVVRVVRRLARETVDTRRGEKSGPRHEAAWRQVDGRPDGPWSSRSRDGRGLAKAADCRATASALLSSVCEGCMSRRARVRMPWLGSRTQQGAMTCTYTASYRHGGAVHACVGEHVRPVCMYNK